MVITVIIINILIIVVFEILNGLLLKARFFPTLCK